MWGAVMDSPKQFASNQMSTFPLEPPLSFARWYLDMAFCNWDWVVPFSTISTQFLEMILSAIESQPSSTVSRAMPD